MGRFFNARTCNPTGSNRSYRESPRESRLTWRSPKSPPQADSSAEIPAAIPFFPILGAEMSERAAAARKQFPPTFRQAFPSAFNEVLDGLHDLLLKFADLGARQGGAFAFGLRTKAL